MSLQLTKTVRVFGPNMIGVGSSLYFRPSDDTRWWLQTEGGDIFQITAGLVQASKRRTRLEFGGESLFEIWEHIGALRFARKSHRHFPITRLQKACSGHIQKLEMVKKPSRGFRLANSGIWFCTSKSASRVTEALRKLSTCRIRFCSTRSWKPKRRVGQSGFGRPPRSLPVSAGGITKISAGPTEMQRLSLPMSCCTAPKTCSESFPCSAATVCSQERSSPTAPATSPTFTRSNWPTIA